MAAGLGQWSAHAWGSIQMCWRHDISCLHAAGMDASDLVSVGCYFLGLYLGFKACVEYFAFLKGVAGAKLGPAIACCIASVVLLALPTFLGTAISTMWAAPVEIAADAEDPSMGHGRISTE